MPIKLLPQLRFLNPSFPSTCLSQMKLGTSINHSRVLPTFSRVFPFKLKYIGSASRGFHSDQLGVRRFSTRPFRSKTDSGSRSGVNRVHERGSIRASKSLVEDEAELSDWISELKTDSFRGRITSGEDSDENGGRNRGRYGDRESLPVKRRRESHSDEFGESNRQRSRSPVNSYSKSSPGVRRFSRDLEDDGKEERINSQRKNWGSRGEDKNQGNLYSKRSPGIRRFGGDSEGDDKDGRINMQRNNRGLRGENRSSFVGKRGGREMDSGYRRSQAGEKLREGRKDSEKQVRLVEDEISDEDEVVDKFMGGIGDLFSEEDGDDVDSADDGEDDDFLLRKSASSLFTSEKELIAREPSKSTIGKSDSYLSETRFDQCSVSPLSLKGVKDAGYERMTIVQEATLPAILKGKDVLAKAKTGTGKTVAFLLPSIEVVVKSPPVGRDQKRPPILVLVICPTRELASQAAAEANSLLKYHPSIGVQVVIGGTRLALEQKRMQANPCQILVATPGRLKDHIENTAGFATRLMGVKVLILDEADHLLDMGFRKDIEKIIAAVPKQRQTLLFSATVPEEVRQICHIALKRDHEFINTVQKGSEETHAQVRQTHIVAPLEKHFSLLYSLLKEHIADDLEYKVLVFCTTAMVTRMVADLLGELNLNVREIHSRKPQSYRTRVSDEFRKSKGLILVTSDVSARGVDYPDVTLVIQIGVPADREQYIHRLGRTGRKGKEGQGILLLAPWEEYFLSTIKDLPLTKAAEPLVDPETKKKVERGLSKVEMKNKEAAYQAWLGYYNSNKKIGKDKYRLVELANEFSQSMGLDNPPAIPKLVLGKMGLRNIPGLRSK